MDFATDVQCFRAKVKQQLCCVQWLPLLVGLQWVMSPELVCAPQFCSLFAPGTATALRARTVDSYHQLLLFFLSVTKSFQFLHLLHHKLLFQGLTFVINLFTALAFKIAASADRFCSWDNNSVDSISIFEV